MKIMKAQANAACKDKNKLQEAVEPAKKAVAVI
jgi:hypothetical protein